MYRIRFGGKGRLASEQIVVSDSECAKLCQAAQVSLNQLLERLQVLAALSQGPVKEEQLLQFSQTVSECRQIINHTDYCDHLLFDGHVSIDRSSRSGLREHLRIRLPNLIHKLDCFHSNFADIVAMDFATFANRIRTSECAHVKSRASIQGVRLNTFLSLTRKTGSLAAVNSITGLTGLYAKQFGNALKAVYGSQDTKMPLCGGSAILNGIELPECDGSVSGFVQGINLETKNHGVHADGHAGQLLVLIAKDGRTINLHVKSQAAALLCGFPLGISEMPKESNGLVGWMNFRQMDEVMFDAGETGVLLTGEDAKTMRLSKYRFDELSLQSDYQRQLSHFAVRVMHYIVEREVIGLQNQINQCLLMPKGQNCPVANQPLSYSDWTVKQIH